MSRNISTVLLCIFAGLLTYGESFCSCPYHHPQAKFCNASFIGKIRIIDASIDEAVENSTVIISGIADILSVYKGPYEDFVIGDRVYVYTPATFTKCRRSFELGDQLISGRAYRGGLFVSQCDFQEMEGYFTPLQIDAIRSHIRTRSYLKGCETCKIKSQFDFSLVKRNECRTKFEFPVPTSACVPTGSGRCVWVARSTSAYKFPPRAPTEDLEPATTTISTTSSTPVTAKAHVGFEPVRDVEMPLEAERSFLEEEEFAEEETKQKTTPSSTSKASTVVDKSSTEPKVVIGTVTFPAATAKSPHVNVIKYLMKVVWPSFSKK